MKQILLLFGLFALNRLKYNYDREKISEIIPGKLYITNLTTSMNIEKLLNIGITDILFINQRTKPKKILDAYKKNSINHKKYNILDLVDSDISKIFDESYDFIEKGKKVIVHCKSGKSRAPTIVIMYLMRKYNMSFLNAINLVRNKRYFINPNPHFIKELKKIEKKKY